MLFIYMMVVAAHLALRPRIPPEKLHLKTWLYPWSGVLTFVAMGAVLVAMAFKDGSRAELIASATCMLVFVACYFIFRRKRAT